MYSLWLLEVEWIPLKLNRKYYSLVTISNALVWVACYLKDAFWNGLKGLRESWTILKAFFQFYRFGRIFQIVMTFIYSFFLYDNSTYWLLHMLKKKVLKWFKLRDIFCVEICTKYRKSWSYVRFQLGKFLAVLRMFVILLKYPTFEWGFFMFFCTKQVQN